MSSVDLPRCQLEHESRHPLVAALLLWVSHVGPFWAASIAGHLALFVVVAVVLGTVHVARTLIDVEPLQVAVNTVIPDSVPLERFIIDETPLVPAALEIPTPTLEDVARLDLPSGPEAPEPLGVTGGTSDPYGSLVNSSKFGLAALIDGGGSDGASQPDGMAQPGSSGAAGTIDGRAERFVKAPPGTTRASKSAVIAALEWFQRHQAPDGGWSLGDYTRKCSDTTCTGAGKLKSDTAATAFAVLPYLAAGFTHQVKSPYQKTIYGGVFSLVKHQAPGGELSLGEPSMMYAHGLATICLCEAFALSKDKHIGAAAQAAIKFIESAQNQDDGGWRYSPGQPGDTSVTGWQLMALKSGQMADLAVNAAVIDLGKKYLKLASAKSKDGGLFGYLPESGPSPSMTAVGLLCTQYLGAKRGHPALGEGQAYLLKSLPDIHRRNSYYWYYGTLAMHNMPGPDWDKWNFAVRRALVESQVKDGCARGSWDPQKPFVDGNADTGGRIMSTSLAALTLEVYYRYSPLYTLDKKDLARRPADQ